MERDIREWAGIRYTGPIGTVPSRISARVTIEGGKLLKLTLRETVGSGGRSPLLLARPTAPGRIQASESVGAAPGD